MQESTLKPIPFSTTKKKLKELYKYVPEEEIKRITNSIISKHVKNNLSNRTIHTHTINHLELVEIVDVLGTPKGHFLTEEFKKALHTFQFQNTSLKQISLNIENCAKEIRSKKISRLNYLEESKNLQEICFKYNLPTKTMIEILGYTRIKDYI